MSREYMREYYHKHKTGIVCCFCFKTYRCKSSLVKHQGSSYKCAIQRINNTFSDFTEAGLRIRDNLDKKEVQDGLKILQRLANNTKQDNFNRKWLKDKATIDIYIMNTHLQKSKMIARVVMAAIADAQDLDQRIGILVNATATIHNECKTYDPLTESERLRSGICTSIALIHLFLEKYGVEALMTVLQKAQEILGETLKLDHTLLKALTDAGCSATEISDWDSKHIHIIC